MARRTMRATQGVVHCAQMYPPRRKIFVHAMHKMCVRVSGYGTLYSMGYIET